MRMVGKRRCRVLSTLRRSPILRARRRTPQGGPHRRPAAQRRRDRAVRGRSVAGGPQGGSDCGSPPNGLSGALRRSGPGHVGLSGPGGDRPPEEQSLAGGTLRRQRAGARPADAHRGHRAAAVKRSSGIGLYMGWTAPLSPGCCMRYHRLSDIEPASQAVPVSGHARSLAGRLAAGGPPPRGTIAPAGGEMVERSTTRRRAL